MEILDIVKLENVEMSCADVKYINHLFKETETSPIGKCPRYNSFPDESLLKKCSCSFSQCSDPPSYTSQERSVSAPTTPSCSLKTKKNNHDHISNLKMSNASSRTLSIDNTSSKRKNVETSSLIFPDSLIGTPSFPNKICQKTPSVISTVESHNCMIPKLDSSLLISSTQTTKIYSQSSPNINGTKSPILSIGTPNSCLIKQELDGGSIILENHSKAPDPTEITSSSLTFSLSKKELNDRSSTNPKLQSKNDSPPSGIDISQNKIINTTESLRMNQVKSVLHIRPKTLPSSIESSISLAINKKSDQHLLQFEDSPETRTQIISSPNHHSANIKSFYQNNTATCNSSGLSNRGHDNSNCHTISPIFSAKCFYRNVTSVSSASKQARSISKRRYDSPILTVQKKYRSPLANPISIPGAKNKKTKLCSLQKKKSFKSPKLTVGAPCFSLSEKLPIDGSSDNPSIQSKILTSPILASSLPLRDDLKACPQNNIINTAESLQMDQVKAVLNISPKTLPYNMGPSVSLTINKQTDTFLVQSEDVFETKTQIISSPNHHSANIKSFYQKNDSIYNSSGLSRMVHGNSNCRAISPMLTPKCLYPNASSVSSASKPSRSISKRRYDSPILIAQKKYRSPLANPISIPGAKNKKTALFQKEYNLKSPILAVGAPCFSLCERIATDGSSNNLTIQPKFLASPTSSDAIPLCNDFKTYSPKLFTRNENSVITYSDIVTSTSPIRTEETNLIFGDPSKEKTHIASSKYISPPGKFTISDSSPISMEETDLIFGDPSKEQTHISSYSRCISPLGKLTLSDSLSISIEKTDLAFGDPSKEQKHMSSSPFGKFTISDSSDLSWANLNDTNNHFSSPISSPKSQCEIPSTPPRFSYPPKRPFSEPRRKRGALVSSIQGQCKPLFIRPIPMRPLGPHNHVDNHKAQLDELLYHMRNSTSLIRDRIYHLKKYSQCLIGSELVDWLVESKNAIDRDSAVSMGRCLVEKKYLRHITKDHHFEDGFFLYTLIPQKRKDRSKSENDRGMKIEKKTKKFYLTPSHGQGRCRRI